MPELDRIRIALRQVGWGKECPSTSEPPSTASSDVVILPTPTSTAPMAALAWFWFVIFQGWRSRLAATVCPDMSASRSWPRWLTKPGSLSHSSCVVSQRRDFLPIAEDKSRMS
ncbi:hypothetical protein LY76DRAFT_596873 [Colletotrichum caudatum]|nr:hypothetical protein LY76DRAFT_596873 [Colletotrichum caudatum]